MASKHPPAQPIPRKSLTVPVYNAAPWGRTVQVLMDHFAKDHPAYRRVRASAILRAMSAAVPLD